MLLYNYYDQYTNTYCLFVVIMIKYSYSNNVCVGWANHGRLSA